MTQVAVKGNLDYALKKFKQKVARDGVPSECKKREGYDKTTVKGQIEFTDEYPGCPYCGSHQLTVCSCGHIGCTHTNEGVYRCEWCGTTGQIGNYTGEAIVAGMDL